MTAERAPRPRRRWFLIAACAGAAAVVGASWAVVNGRRPPATLWRHVVRDDGGGSVAVYEKPDRSSTVHFCVAGGDDGMFVWWTPIDERVVSALGIRPANEKVAGPYVATGRQVDGDHPGVAYRELKLGKGPDLQTLLRRSYDK